MEDALAIVFIFGGATLCVLGFSPIGRAFAERIRGRSAHPDAGELRAELAEQREAMAEDLQQLRRELAELGERMDFAERLLARQREPDRLPRA